MKKAIVITAIEMGMLIGIFVGWLFTPPSLSGLTFSVIAVAIFIAGNLYILPRLERQKKLEPADKTNEKRNWNRVVIFVILAICVLMQILLRFVVRH
jgi:hypothetical protein